MIPCSFFLTAACSLAGPAALQIETPPPLAQLIVDLGDANPRTRREAADRLEELGPRALEAVPALAQCVRDPAPDVRSSAVCALKAIGPEAKAAIPNLVKQCCAESDPGTQIAFAGVFARIGSAAMPTLLRALADPGRTPNCRRRLVYQLAYFGREGKAALPALRPLLRGKDNTLAFDAAWAITRIEPNDKAALGLLIRASADPATAIRAAVALADTPAKKRAVPVLRKWLQAAWNHRNAARYGGAYIQEAAAALGNIGPDAAPAVGQLIEYLDAGRRDGDTRFELPLAQALLLIDPLSKKARRVLRTSLKEVTRELRTSEEDSDDSTLLFCIRTLAILGPEAAPAAGSLRKLQKDWRARVRRAAKEALIAIGERK